MARYTPTTLDTVLENMPLVYNSATKRLERRQQLRGAEMKMDGNSGSGDDYCSPNEPGSAAPLIGSEPKSMLATETPSSSAGVGGLAGCCLGDAASAVTPPSRPFKKGHVRHSSYESAEIQFYPRGNAHAVCVPMPPSARRASAAPAGCDVSASSPRQTPRTTSALLPPPTVGGNAPTTAGCVHRATDSVSSTVSFCSHYGSDYSTNDDASHPTASTAACCCTAGGGGSSVDGGDSGCAGGGASKRSSLDRKSQCSSSQSSHSSSGVVCRRVLDGTVGADDDDVGEKETEKSGGQGQPRKRTSLVLPTISLPKSLFSRKTSAGSGGAGGSVASSSSPWRLFSSSRATAPPPQPPSRANQPVPSTTALIINDRPACLPAKSDAEAQRHRQQYEAILEAAKKKEQRDAKLRKKAQEQQRKLEENVSAASKLWNEEILPKWDDMRHTKKCRDLWWQGLPPSARGRVWSMVIGNDLNITTETYEQCLMRAKEKLATSGADGVEPAASADEIAPSSTKPSSSPHMTAYSAGGTPVVNREETVSLIHLDVARTFPALGIFQQGGPYYDLLLQLLGAYVCYRPDVGYMQSMSFVAAVLLLNSDAPRTAFIAFANLLHRPLQTAFYRLRQPDMTNYFIAYDQYFRQELPRLHAHFDLHDVPPDLYLIEWLYTLYAKSLPYDITCRVWDVYLRDGEEFLFKTALGILRTFETELLAMEFDQCVQFLSHLPQERVTARQLFKNIEPFLKTPPATADVRRRRRFAHILADVSERLGAAASVSPTPDVAASSNSRLNVLVSGQTCTWRGT